MLSRRTLFSATAGVISALSLAFGKKAHAKTVASDTAFDIEARSKNGRLERLPTLNAESRNDFLTGVRNWRGATLVPASRERFNNLVKEAGKDPNGDLPLKRIFKIVGDDPLVNLEGRIRIDAQRLAHQGFKQSFENQADTYLSELADYDKSGPGTLELNPDMDIPDYARHEIHMQPGGYVGNEFAGPIYHYGTNAFFEARGTMNYQDESHARLARQVAASAPGKDDVRRVLDLGCGIGQLTVALKEEYPEAEVWGVDIGAPMIRYGHMRAVDHGVDVNFAQRLAEKTQFPDNHFDIIASFIMHHEMPAETSRQVIAEAFRILRPGGVYVPIDFFTGGGPRRPATAFNSYQRWKDYRWNNEVWRLEYEDMDYFGHMEKVGFNVNREGPGAAPDRTNVVATKPA